MPTPYLLRRHHTWYLRVRTPTDLAPALGTHTVRSLRTAHYTEAREAAPRALVALAAAWATVRRVTDDPPPDETPEALRRRLQEAWARYQRGKSVVVTVGRDTLREALDPARPRREADAAALARALRAEGVVAPAALPAAAAPATTDPRAALPLSSLLDEYHRHYDHGDSTRTAHQQAVRDFESQTGTPPISRITPANLATFRAWLQERPGRHGRATAATATVTKSLNHVRAVLKWATEESGILAENPGSKVKPPRKKKSEAGPQRLSFDSDELKKIFGSPLYMECAGRKRLSEEGPYIFKDDRYYFLLCLLLTGARTEELPGSRVIDHGDTPCLDLRQTGTKTTAGARLVPVLPALSRAGFTAWAAKQPAGGLFRGPHAPGDWSKWTNNYLNNIGVTDRLHVASSLRHSYRKMLRTANLNTELVNLIFGHETGTTGEGHGRVLTPEQAALVAKTVRPPVDLSHLYAKAR